MAEIKLCQWNGSEWVKLELADQKLYQWNGVSWEKVEEDE